MSLTFQDFYLKDGVAFGSTGLWQPLTPLDQNDWQAIYKRCLEHSKSFAGQIESIEFDIEHAGERYRVSRIDDIISPTFVLRRIGELLPSVDLLNKHAVSKVCTPRELTGLIPVCGAFAQGKTTTAIALILERLRRHGGVCVTIEDPIEHKISGAHGKGIVLQTHLGDDASEMVKRSMRWAASILFVGEIRTPGLAAEVVRASLMGTLVLCTIHAGSVESGLERLFALTQAGFGSANEASSALSAGLTGVWHQRLKGDPLTAEINYLSFSSGESSMGLRQMVRERQFFQLGSEVQRQQIRMQQMA